MAYHSFLVEPISCHAWNKDRTRECPTTTIGCRGKLSPCLTPDPEILSVRREGTQAGQPGERALRVGGESTALPAPGTALGARTGWAQQRVCPLLTATGGFGDGKCNLQ